MSFSKFHLISCDAFKFASPDVTDANSKNAGDLLKWTAKRTLDDMFAISWRFQQSIELGGS